MIKRSEGYVALIAVLLVGAVSVAIGLLLLVSGVDNQRVALVNQQSAQARLIADACAEDALQDIHDNTSLTGTSSVSLGAGSCTYTITSVDSTSRIIAVSGTVDNVVRKVKIYVTIGSSSISVTSWLEVGDL